MPDLQIDLDGLDVLYADLTHVRKVFDAAACLSFAVGSAVGDEGLESKVGDFESKWDDRRGKISQSMLVVAGAIEAISRTYREVDTKLSAAVTIQPSAGVLPKATA